MATFTTAIQQNLLTLLAFDNVRCRVIRGVVQPSLFEGHYQEIVRRTYTFIDKYGHAPAEHVADLLDDIIEGKDKKRSNVFKNILINLYNAKDTVNADYTMDRLTDFVKEQNLKSGIIEAAELLQQSGTSEIDRAYKILQGKMKANLSLFDRGIMLSDIKSSFSFLDEEEIDVFPTGIREFDRIGVGPARKELFMFIAKAKFGKTWWLINLGKQGLLHRKRVLHVSLEMSEKRMAQRYFQSLFSIPKRKGKYPQSQLDISATGKILGIEVEELRAPLYLEHPKIREMLKAKVDNWGARFDNLIIKEFPTGQLTIDMLNAYLENLEASEGFIPDLLLLDYPDIMKISATHKREDLGRTVVDLRGIGVERNMAVGTASQINRSGASKKLVEETDVAEDWSKIFTVDNLVTYSRTKAESELNLARLYLAAARNEADKFTVLITQNYARGQFAINSTIMNSIKNTRQYFNKLKEIVGDSEEEEE